MIFGALSNSSAAHQGPAPAVAKAGMRPRSPRDSETASTTLDAPDMRHEGHRETEMKPRGIAHQCVARGQIGMHGKWRLHIGEGRDDDAPDALDGVERQVAVMALDQPPHHVGLAGGPERGSGFLALFDRDQPVDDLAALDQQVVHFPVDAIDLDPQFGKRRARFWDDDFDGGFGIYRSRQLGRLIGVVKPEIKENIDLSGNGPIYAPLIAGSALEHDPEKRKSVFG